MYDLSSIEEGFTDGEALLVYGACECPKFWRATDDRKCDVVRSSVTNKIRYVFGKSQTPK